MVELACFLQWSFGRWQPTSTESIEDNTKRKNIARELGFAKPLFWCHICGGPGLREGNMCVFGQKRQAKISQDNLDLFASSGRLTKEDICWLNVSMDHTFVVKVLYSSAELFKDAQYLSERA